MRICGVSSQTFGNLIYSNSIDNNILGKKSSRAVNMELQRITKIIKDEKLDCLENVDIILVHKKVKYKKKHKNVFYGMISSKDEGVPMHPDYTCPVLDSKGSLKKFKEWALSWDEAYAPESLSIFEKAFRMVHEGSV